MSWIPWLLLLAIAVLFGWALAEIGRCVRWARRAMLRGEASERPRGWLVRTMRLDELFLSIESRSANESEIRAA